MFDQLLFLLLSILATVLVDKRADISSTVCPDFVLEVPRVKQTRTGAAGFWAVRVHGAPWRAAAGLRGRTGVSCLQSS